MEEEEEGGESEESESGGGVSDWLDTEWSGYTQAYSFL